MARHLSNLPRDYMCKFPGLSKYLTERPEVNGYALIDDAMLAGVLLMSDSRVHYLFVPSDMRRGGYGRELIDYAFNTISNKKVDLLSRVDDHDQEALAFMISCGFEITGWSVRGDNRGYMLTRRRNSLPVIKMAIDPMVDAVAEMVDKLLVVETLPVQYLNSR